MSPNPIELVLHPKAWESLNVLEAVEKDQCTKAIEAFDLTPDERAAVLTQLDLRDAAETKLGKFARTMIFTRDGLEQATRLEVAALHAARFKNAGITTVADLGCGMGVDSIALAGLDLNVCAWDLDPQAVAAATVNLRFHENAEVNHGDVTKLDISELISEGVEGIFADPARRTGAQSGGRRINNPEDWSPALSTVLSWREHLQAAGHDAIGIKVAPGIAYVHIPSDFEAQWISVDRQLVEASLWSPDLTDGTPKRSATIIREGKQITLTEAGDPSTAPEQAPVSALENYLFEPDPAIIRAGLIASIVRDWGLSGTISPNIAYLTSNSIPEGDAGSLAAFEVLEVTNLRPKNISKALRAMEPTAIEVKKRGSDINPAALQTALNRILVPKTEDYENELTVFATRVDGCHQAIIARRL